MAKKCSDCKDFIICYHEKFNNMQAFYGTPTSKFVIKNMVACDKWKKKDISKGKTWNEEVM